MALNFPPSLPPSLAHLQRVGADQSVLPPALGALQAGPIAVHATRAGLAFDAWGAVPDYPTVLGDRPYPGSATDPTAVADAIVGLLFERP